MNEGVEKAILHVLFVNQRWPGSYETRQMHADGKKKRHIYTMECAWLAKWFSVANLKLKTLCWCFHWIFLLSLEWIAKHSFKSVGQCSDFKTVTQNLLKQEQVKKPLKVRVSSKIKHLTSDPSLGFVREDDSCQQHWLPEIFLTQVHFIHANGECFRYNTS